jgi:serine/threonine-protein kinase RsbT
MDVVEVRVHLASEEGLVEARRQSRELATRAGFRPTDQAIVAALVSELGRNILLYATMGDILIRVVRDRRRAGILIVASDAGPGIPDIGKAMSDLYSTSGRLGIGLPGVRRLSDEFEISGGPGYGTTVRAQVWCR